MNFMCKCAIGMADTYNCSAENMIWKRSCFPPKKNQLRNVSNNDAEVYTEIFRHIWKIQIDTDFSTSVSAERLACVSITGDRTKNILSVKIRQTNAKENLHQAQEHNNEK